MTTLNGANIIREQEIGLQLPNGEQIFPPDLWHDRSLDGAVARQAILETLRLAAANLGYPEIEFLTHYHWVSRDKITTVMYEDGGDEMPITSTGYIEIVADDRVPQGEQFLIPSETVQTVPAAD
jgi:hypothetical protein